MSKLFSRSKVTIRDAFQSPAAARHLHGDFVKHFQRDEFRDFDRRNDAFVHQDGQRALPRQALIAAHQVRRERRLQGFEAGFRELGRHRNAVSTS